MSASTTRPFRHSIPLPLSIVARPHEAGLIRSWRADSLAFVWLDPGITPCCKSRKSNNPKNLAKLIFGLLCRCVAFQRRYGGPCSILDEIIGSPHVPARKTHRRSLEFSFNTPKRLLQQYLPRTEGERRQD